MISCSCLWRSMMIAIALICSWPSLAQDSIDEIIVLADYRGRSDFDLPASITILDAEKISGKAVQHFEELIDSLPNLNWSGDGHRAKYLQIRGVGELQQYEGAPNPSVGFIIDDIDFSGIGTIATLFDIDRIEVLRGPQGTRYGANALAGLIYMQSPDPDEELSGKVNLIVGDDDAAGGGLAVGGPIGPNSGFRLSAYHYQSDGFRSNPFLFREDTNGRDETSLRGRVDWTSGDDWSFKLTGMLSDVDDGYDAFAIDNSLTVLSDKPGKDAQESVGASFRADWAGGRSFSVISITSLADSDIEFSFDADWGNDDAWAPVLYDFISRNDRQRRTLSQEIRLTSTEEGRIFGDQVDWLAGLYVSRLDEDLTTVNRGDYFDPGFNFTDTVDDRLASQFDAINTAIFGQFDFDVGERGRISAGARIERRTSDYADSNGLVQDPSETMWGGALTYTHLFSDILTGYASLSRGYKAGGFNLGFVPPGRRAFEEESVWSLETGVKSVLADGRIRFDAAAFYNVRNDQQVNTSFQTDPNDPVSFVFFTDNAAKGKTIGLEAELRWMPSDSWEVYASAGLLDAEFDEFVTPQVNSSGRDQAHAPRYTVALGTMYTHASGAFARLDVTAKDEYYFDVSHDQKSNSYSVANARFGYAADQWTAQLWIRNAFDERYAVRGFFFGNEPPNFPPTLYIRQGDPRQIGVSIDMRF